MSRWEGSWQCWHDLTSVIKCLTSIIGVGRCRLDWFGVKSLQATLHAVTAAHATQIGPIIANLRKKYNKQRNYCTLPNFTNLNDLTMSLTSIKNEVKASRLYQCRSPRSWQRWQTHWQTDWKTLTKSCEQKMQQERDARCRKSLRCNSMPKMPEMFLNNKNRAKTTGKRHYRKQCRSIQNTTWDTVTQTLQPLDIKYIKIPISCFRISQQSRDR